MPTIVDLTVPSSPIAEAVSPEAALRTAILSVQPTRLRLVLLHICDFSVDASAIAQRLLLVPEDESRREMVDRGDESDSERDVRDEDDDEEDGDQTTASEDNTDRDDETSVAQRSISEIDNVHGTLSGGAKRLRSRFATCENCSTEFDVTDNGKNDCVWHPGEKEADLDSDFWADHDERCHGRIDDLEDEYPEGFIYSCCEGDGTSEGCQMEAHIEVEDSSKRARV